ncbi:hypothetical protein A8144_02540 [Mycobacterium leprae 3125609]|nr:hypothetical protein A8144_02540 [Mycobacterium leprae 3125609]OAX70377.1 hypothetical protein A3216_12445 [Mycobacterium leprae 7935681]
MAEVEDMGFLAGETACSVQKGLRLLCVGQVLGVSASGYEIHHSKITRGDATEECLGGARNGQGVRNDVARLAR